MAVGGKILVKLSLVVTENVYYLYAWPEGLGEVVRKLKPNVVCWLFLTSYTDGLRQELVSLQLETKWNRSFLTPFSEDVILPGENELGFLGGTGGKEPTCQCRGHKRHGFDPRVGKIPWRRNWQPTPVLLPGKFHGGSWWATVHKVTKSLTWLKWLSKNANDLRVDLNHLE